MFIKNNSNKDLRLHSFEGFEFTAPPGISAIWDKAGTFWIETLAPKGENGKVGHKDGMVTFKEAAPPTPGITESTKEDWEKEGKKLAQVNRFQIKAGMIPRAALIEIAGQRGVPLEKIQGNKTDDDILEKINGLPVQNELRFPVNLNEN